ncbi:uncharacterized protein PFL1_06027 [Pseudozyma flocculosa PF-1]|uniref:MAPKK kinase Kpp4 n=1 Tax=Pseudozyma flocculosa PF-1 TaxID=1277687 RepID=A0A061H2C7_9BASI|nr:uncharacterized protein PFL1_06027 [Pseudozyma flocculosa PF-1]EPQ26379.1 hypothetical protein PFL1_06027 [Pseudozyma flocculosa PF-1]
MSAATPTSPGFPLGVGSSTSMTGIAGGPSSVSGSPRGTSRPTTPLSAGIPVLGPTYEDVRKWEDADIAAWLQSARLGAHAATFVEHDIRGSVVLDVDQAALKEMGIVSVGDRVRIFAAIKALNKRCADSAAFERRRRGSASSLSATSPRRIHISLPRSDPYQNGHSQDGEMEYLEYDNADLERTDEAGELAGAGSGRGSLGGRGRQIRPPPLLLKQSASRGLPGHPSPVSSINNGQGFGLSAARGLTPGAGRGSISSRGAGAVPSKPGDGLNGSGSNGAGGGGSLHRKVNSIGSSSIPGVGAAPSLSQGKGATPAGLLGLSASRGQPGQALASGRPSTATGAGAYGSLHSHGQGRGLLGSPSTGASSPTTAGFSQSVRPSTAGGAGSYGGGGGMSSNGQSSYAPLTPITESSGSHHSTPANGGQRSDGSTATTPSNGYTVGRGPFASASSSSGSASAAATRPITPGREWVGAGLQHSSSLRRPETADAYGSNVAPPPTLEDLKRRTIKFISEEDKTTRTVNVSDCRDAYDVMSRVLKKFGKPASGNSYRPTADQGPTGDDLGATETWGIFATSADGQNTKALSDNELLAICHAPQVHDPLRERGLTLRRIPNHLPGEDVKRAPPRSGRHKLEAFFGERMPVNQMSLAPPGSPRDQDGDAGSVTISGKKMRRASTVSIMSGLGVGYLAGVGGGGGGSGGSGGAKDRSNGSGTIRQKDGGTIRGNAPAAPAAAPRPSKIRNFFGQRPPSELINTNLADFFPSTDSKALQRTARRSIYGRASASTRSKRNSTWSFSADPDAPPLPGKESLDVPRLSPDRERASPSPSNLDRDGMPIIQIGFGSRPDEIVERKSSQQSSREGPPTLPPIVGRSSLDDWSRGLQAVGTPVAELGSFPSKPTSSRPNMSRRTSMESSRSRRSLASQVRHGLLGGGRASGARRSYRSSSRAASTRPSSGLSSSVEEEDDDQARPDSDLDETISSLIRRPSADAPRPSLDEGSAVAAAATGTDAAASAPAVTLTGAPAVADAGAAERDISAGDLRKSVSSGGVAAGTATADNSGSSLRRSEFDSDDDDLDEDEDDFSDEDEDDEDDEDDDEEEADSEVEAETSIYRSQAANKTPIKWHKGALIGAGSFGNVFLGMNAKTGLLMAVKQVELPSGDSHLDQRKKGMLEALEREIKLLKTLQHENIVQYLDSFADGSHLNIFLEYVPGGSIVALLRNYGAFEEPLVRNFVGQILKGLSFLHARDIVHRDIKGANILVDNKGGIKISDFGISKKVESDLLVSARAHRPSLQGSVFWMAPEVVKQTSYTRKADIWSLGCLVVEMISGTHPWAELNQMQALFQIGMSKKPTMPDEISAEAVDFLNKTFELDHTLRPSADELLQHAFITDDYTGVAGGEGAGEAAGTGAVGASTSSSTTTPTAATSTVTGTTTTTLVEGDEDAAEAKESSAAAAAASTAAAATTTAAKEGGGKLKSRGTLKRDRKERGEKKDDAAGAAATAAATAPPTTTTATAATTSPPTIVVDKDKDEGKDANGIDRDRDRDESKKEDGLADKAEGAE